MRLQDCLPSILEPSQERAKERQQNLYLDIPAALPPLLAMENGLERVVAELLNNACKYTPWGARSSLAPEHLSGPTPLIQAHVAA